MSEPMMPKRTRYIIAAGLLIVSGCAAEIGLHAIMFVLAALSFMIFYWTATETTP